MSTFAPLTQLSDLDLSVRDAAREFASTVVEPVALKMDEEGKLDKAVLKGMFDAGLMGIEIPEQYGGSGFTFTQSCLVIEELAKADPAVSVVCDIQNTLINTSIIRWGTPEQKKEFLPRLAKDTVMSFCLSEASAGSDAFALKTTAMKKGDKYVINGDKMWISNAEEAAFYLVFANVNPGAGYKGITAFIVERNAPGFRVGKKESKLGLRASSTCELYFDNVEVHESRVLGKVGEGYKVAIGILNEGRVGIAAQMIGLAQGSFDHALAYMKERKQFGQSIANFQGVQFQYAQLATEIESARLLMLNAARLKDSGLPFVKEAAMAKLLCSQIAQKAASSACNWLGGMGFVHGKASKHYRDAKIGEIYEGTTNMQLQTIAKLLLKD